MSVALNNIHASAHGLHQLLGVLYEVSTELDFAPGNEAATRLASLLILARDEAERIDTAIGHTLAPDGEAACAEVGVISTLGEEYEEAVAAWIAADEAADAPDASEALKAAAKGAEEKHDMYRDALFGFTSLFPAAMAEKATILLRVWNRAEGMSDERIVQLFQSMGGRLS